ncbi:MAG: alpha/beta hydrolase [Pseudonocardiales bacterium]|nr:alpha/beta hydrolase [Pseudonocardiales bacterium]
MGGWSGAADEVQGVVDELAERLGRSVVVNDPLVRPLCSSRHFGDADPVRIRAILQRDPGDEVRPLCSSRHFGDADPVRIRAILQRDPGDEVRPLVVGCDGSHVSPGSQRYIAEQVPGAQLYVFPVTEANSHFPFLENPDRFNAVVAEFLDA